MIIMNHVLDVPAACHIALRAHLIFNNPIPECQSIIVMRESSNELFNAVCTTVFGIYYFEDFRLNEKMITCMA